MPRTSISLLDRLRAAEPDPSDWQRLDEIYRPLIHGWLSRVPGLGDEAADLAQEVLVVLVREIARFERQREGSFRAWLRKITVNKVRTHRRRRQRRRVVGQDAADGFLDQLEDPSSDLARELDLDHDRHVFRKMLAIIQPDFSAATWEAFRRFALDGLPAARVAEDLDLSVNAVIQAKARILRRLREESGELLE